MWSRHFTPKLIKDFLKPIRPSNIKATVDKTTQKWQKIADATPDYLVGEVMLETMKKDIWTDKLSPAFSGLTKFLFVDLFQSGYFLFRLKLTKPFTKPSNYNKIVDNYKILTTNSYNTAIYWNLKGMLNNNELNQEEFNEKIKLAPAIAQAQANLETENITYKAIS